MQKIGLRVQVMAIQRLPLMGLNKYTSKDVSSLGLSAIAKIQFFELLLWLSFTTADLVAFHDPGR